MSDKAEPEKVSRYDVVWVISLSTGVREGVSPTRAAELVDQEKTHRYDQNVDSSLDLPTVNRKK